MSAVGTTTVAEGATSEPQHSVATGSVADGAGQTTTAVRAGTHAVESVASYISIEKLLRLMSELEHVLKRAGRMNECWDNNSAAGGGLSRRERWKNRVSRFHTNVLRQRHSASAVTVTVGGAGASVAFLSVCRTLLALIIELEAEVKYSCQHFRWRSRLRERFLDFITSHLEKLSGITCRSPPLDFATGATPHPLPIAVDIKHVASSALLALEGSLPNIRWGLGGAPSDGDETNALVPPPRSASRRRDWIVELKALGGEYIFDVERNAPQGGDADHDVPPPTPPIADARASVSASMTSSPLLAASTPSASSLASTDTDDEVVNDGVLPLQSRARGDASIDGNAVDVGAGDAHVMLGNINNRLDSLLSQIETVRLEHGGEAIVAGSAAAVDGDTDHEVESLSADVVLPSMSAAPPPPSGAQLRPIGGGVGGGGDHHEHDLSIDIIANSELSSGSSSYLRAMQGSLDYWRLEASSLRRTKTDMENEIGLMRQLLDLQKMELSQMANRYNEQSLRLRQMMGDISAMDTMSYQELSQLEFCLGESIAAVRSRKDEIWERMEKNMSKVTRSCAVCMENFPDTVLMPCGHSCLCHECCHQLLNTGDSGGNSLLDDAGGSGRELKCPICRTAIVSTIRIFV